MTTKGKHLTEETKKKISESKKGKVSWNKGLKNPRPNYHHSEETKCKISLGNKGKKQTKETKNKIRLKKLGTHHSDDTKRKIGLSSKGRECSEERKEKIREIRKREKEQGLSPFLIGKKNEDLVSKDFIEQGFQVLNINDKGFPDLIVLKNKKIILFCEVKTLRGNLTDIQKEYHKKLNDIGFSTQVIFKEGIKK